MPNRILRESITTSATIDGLSAEAEVLFYRLLVVADDYGLMDARPAVVLARCYPLRVDDSHSGKLSTGSVAALLGALVQAELITLYESGGKPFLAINQWDQHQRIRAKRSHYPLPPSYDSKLQQSAASGGHLSLARAESESESESKNNPNVKTVPGGVSDDTTTRSPKTRAVKPPIRKTAPDTAAGIDGTRANQYANERSEAGTCLPPSTLVWNAYKAAYAVRYGADPVRNATTNAQVVQLIKRVGANEAPEIAAFFVGMRDPFYARKGHTLGALLADAEKIRTEWATGRPITGGTHDASTRRAQTIASLTGGTPAIDG